MALRLIKTLLSKKVSPQSILVALTSYLVLLLVFIFNNPLLKANGQIVYGEGQYWRAFTSSLMHHDFIHLSHNSLFFVVFAALLNNYFGPWIFPVLSFLMGGIINLAAFKYHGPEVYVVGISGVIYFMTSFWMTMFVLLERQLPLKKRFIITIGVSLALFWPESFEPQVSHFSHGMGFGLGIPAALIWFQMKKDSLRGHEKWIEKIDVIDMELERQALDF